MDSKTTFDSNNSLLKELKEGKITGCKFKTTRPIAQSASFYDTNRGERPNLTACTKPYLLHADNQNNGYEDSKNHAVFTVYNGSEMAPSLSSKRVGYLIDTLFPIAENMFGACHDGKVDYWNIDHKGQISLAHTFSPSKQWGFQGEPPVAFSSFQHFYDPENVTICVKGDNLESLIYDAETLTLLHEFSFAKPFMKEGPYFAMGGEDSCCTLDLREPFRGETKSRIGYNSRFKSHFLLLDHDGSVISCYDHDFQVLPRGILSTAPALPHWGSCDRYHASIYGSHYLASPHMGILWKFHPTGKKELAGIASGNYFGGNPSMIFDAYNEYWL